MNRRLPIVIACLAIAITGCTTPAPAEKPVETASTASTTPGPVSSLEELKERFTAAGAECHGEFTKRDYIPGALNSGSCLNTGSDLAVFQNSEDAERAAKQYLNVDGGAELEVIIGENWVITPSGGDRLQAKELAQKMGARYLVREQKS